MSRLVGLVLIVVTLFLLWRSVAPGAPAPLPQVDQAFAQDAGDLGGLFGGGGGAVSSSLVGEVAAMCSGSCEPWRFVPLEETSGTVNPQGVKFLSDYATFAAFDVPAGWSGQYWDGSVARQFGGPVHLPQVAEASFRKASTGR